MDKRKAVIAELPHLLRYARALKRDTQAADDLMQECVYRALSKLHLFAAGTNMRAWLFTVLHNIHIQDLRRGGRGPGFQPLDYEAEIASRQPARQDDRLALRDLDRALGQLADEQREVVLLVGLEDMSYKQAAEILAVPVGTVMSRLSRGRENLRRAMEDGAQPALRRVK